VSQVTHNATGKIIQIIPQLHVVNGVYAFQTSQYQAFFWLVWSLRPMWQRRPLRKDRRPFRKKADNKNREETCQAAIPPLRRQL
jgi:hypothetical protein